MAVPVRRTFAALCAGGAGGAVNEARWSYPPERGDNDDGDEDDIPNPIFQDGSRSQKGKGRPMGGREGEVEARRGWSSSSGWLAGRPAPNLIGTGPDDDQLSYQLQINEPGRKEGWSIQ